MQPLTDCKCKVASTPTNRAKHTSIAGITDQDIPSPPNPKESTKKQTEPTSPLLEDETMLQTPSHISGTRPPGLDTNLYGNLDDNYIMDNIFTQTQTGIPQQQSLPQELPVSQSKGNKAKKC